MFYFKHNGIGAQLYAKCVECGKELKADYQKDNNYAETGLLCAWAECEKCEVDMDWEAMSQGDLDNLLINLVNDLPSVMIIKT